MITIVLGIVLAMVSGANAQKTCPYEDQEYEALMFIGEWLDRYSANFDSPYPKTIAEMGIFLEATGYYEKHGGKINGVGLYYIVLEEDAVVIMAQHKDATNRYIMELHRNQPDRSRLEYLHWKDANKLAAAIQTAK